MNARDKQRRRRIKKIERERESERDKSQAKLKFKSRLSQKRVFVYIVCVVCYASERVSLALATRLLLSTIYWRKRTVCQRSAQIARKADITVAHQHSNIGDEGANQQQQQPKSREELQVKRNKTKRG